MMVNVLQYQSARAYHLLPLEYPFIAGWAPIYSWFIQIGSLTNSKIKEHLLLSLHEVATSWEFHINAHTIYI